MNQVTVNVWWAGHKLKNEETLEEEVSSIIEEWQQRLNAKEISVLSVGILMIPAVLCIDVLSDGRLVSHYDLKQK